MPRKNFFPKNPVIPSKVIDTLSISYNGKTAESEDEDSSEYSSDEEDTENSSVVRLLRPFVKKSERRSRIKDKIQKNLLKEIYIGKWMMFCNNKRIYIARGMTHLDYMWQFVKPLVDDSKNTYITSAHCSTGNPFPYGTNPKAEVGVICCLTKDYRKKCEVKKAAEAIRNVLYYPQDLYYKTDTASLSGHYGYFGHKFVSIYKYTTDNKLYERDEKVPHLWNPVIFEL